MSRDNWKVPEAERPPEQFWIDYGNFVMASYRFVSEDDGYWETLIFWANVLMNRYNNHTVNLIVMDYIDSQSIKSGKEEDRKRHEERNDRKISVG